MASDCAMATEAMKIATVASSARAGFAAISIGIAMNTVKILKTLFNFMVFLPMSSLRNYARSKDDTLIILVLFLRQWRHLHSVDNDRLP